MVVRVIPIRLVRSLASLGAVVALLGSVAPAGAATVDFDGFSGGTLLTTQLEGSLGIRFPEGVEVVETARSLSSPNVARPQLDGEFRRDAFEARFSSGQVSVSLWVRADEDPDPPVDVEYTLSAFDDFGFPVSSDSVTVSTDSGWHQLAVSDPSSEESIRRIILTGRRTGSSSNTNFLIVDDLTFEGAEPPPPSDDTPPDVVILDPSVFVTVTERRIDLVVTVSEDEQLQTVVGEVTHVSSGTTAAPLELCGTTFSGVCPDTSLDYADNVFLDPAIEGRHRIRIEACDSAGNCDQDTQDFEYSPEEPPELPDVRAHRVEVNQGVQGRLVEVTGPGTAVTPRFDVPLIQGRDAVVRFYVLADGADRPDFSAELDVRIERSDGSNASREFPPNAGDSMIEVVEDPGSTSAREDEFLRMRADLSRTLDYVIPGSFLEDADFMELILQGEDGPLSGRVQLDVRAAVRLGLNLIRFTGEPFEDGGRAFDESNVVGYLERALPVSEVRVLSRRTLPWPSGALELFLDPTNCFSLLWLLKAEFGGGSAPATFPESVEGPTYAVSLGVVDADVMSNALGCAKLSNPDKRGSRLGAPAVTGPWADTGAQEVGHGIGLIHASKDHGESGGGSAEEWPYEHGSIGFKNFGLIPEVTADPGSFDFGEWDLTLVDPCPASDVTDRRPTCSLSDDKLVHDFMSYGANGGPVPFFTSKGRWTSDRTYNRIYQAIRFGSKPRSGGTGEIASRRTDGMEALLIDGRVREDGSVDPLPLMRTRAFPEEVEDVPPGDHTLEVRSLEGELIERRSFEPVPVTLHDREVAFLDQVIPYREDVGSIVVSKDGETLMESKASASPPHVRLLAPEGEETVGSGFLTVRWDAGDADGDLSHVQVDLSPDEGETWQSLGTRGAGGPQRLRVNTAELPETTRALVRVTASDGMRTATDVSDCPVSVGTDEPPVECDQAAPEPPGEEFLTDPAFPDFGFQVRITAGDTVLFGSREPDCLPETLCVSGDLEGRSEIFVRIVGPKPNGKLWPNLVKFSTSTVEVWVQQTSTGVVKYYELAGATPGSSELPGLFDRDGFDPQGASGGLQVSERSAERPAEGLTERLAERSGLDPRADEAPPPPPGEFLTSDRFPDFRFKVRITAGDEVQDHRKEPLCIDETVCVSGALPGRSELFLRIVGPKPNGKLWPTLVKFSTSQVEVWIEQISTGVTKYYVLEGASPGSSDLTGLFDREGFEP